VCGGNDGLVQTILKEHGLARSVGVNKGCRHCNFGKRLPKEVREKMAAADRLKPMTPERLKILKEAGRKGGSITGRSNGRYAVESGYLARARGAAATICWSTPEKRKAHAATIVAGMNATRANLDASSVWRKAYE
jgi:hypothetical protein